MRRKYEIWDYIAWIVLILITVWVILKVLGIINTPLWLQYSPVFGGIYLAGWAMHKLERATRDIDDIKVEIKDVKEELKDVEMDMEILKNRFPEVKRD